MSMYAPVKLLPAYRYKATREPALLLKNVALRKIRVFATRAE